MTWVNNSKRKSSIKRKKISFTRKQGRSRVIQLKTRSRDNEEDLFNRSLRSFRCWRRSITLTAFEPLISCLFVWTQANKQTNVIQVPRFSVWSNQLKFVRLLQLHRHRALILKFPRVDHEESDSRIVFDPHSNSKQTTPLFPSCFSLFRDPAGVNGVRLHTHSIISTHLIIRLNKSLFCCRASVFNPDVSGARLTAHRRVYLCNY